MNATPATDATSLRHDAMRIAGERVDTDERIEVENPWTGRAMGFRKLVKLLDLPAHANRRVRRLKSKDSLPMFHPGTSNTLEHYFRTM